jgi:hypothetical protein
MSELTPFLAALGIPIVVFAILGVVFYLIGKVLDQARAELNAEGVEKASERVIISTRFKGFRAPGLITSGFRRNPGYLVLTRERLIVLQRPQRYGIFARGDLGHLRVSVDDGALRVFTDEPPGATGSVNYRVPVPDAADWVKTLVAAGAKAG